MSTERTDCKSGGCVGNAVDLTSGNLPFVPESGLRVRRSILTGRQKSAEDVLGTQVLKVRTVPARGRRERRVPSATHERQAQKNQLVLAFLAEGTGEAQRAAKEGTESLVAEVASNPGPVANPKFQHLK